STPVCSRGMCRTRYGPSWNWCERPAQWGEVAACSDQGHGADARECAVHTWHSAALLHICESLTKFEDKLEGVMGDAMACLQRVGRSARRSLSGHAWRGHCALWP